MQKPSKVPANQGFSVSGLIWQPSSVDFLTLLAERLANRHVIDFDLVRFFQEAFNGSRTYFSGCLLQQKSAIKLAVRI